MKAGTVILSIIFTIMNITPVLASGRHGNHYNKHNHRNRHYYGDHGHRNYNRYSYGRHRYYDDHNDYAAYALGGLVVGGILGAAINNSYNAGAGNSNYNQPVYSHPRSVNNGVQPSYVIQPDGICYLVSHVNNGSLVLSPVASTNCR